MMTIILSVIKAAILGYLIYLSIHDIRYKKVTNFSLVMLLPLIVLHCTAVCSTNRWTSIFSMLFGAVAGGGILLAAALITHGGIGGGDIKLAAVLGFATGFSGMTVMLMTASVAAVVYGLIKKKCSKNKAVKLAFVPFIAIGYLVQAIFSVLY